MNNLPITPRQPNESNLWTLTIREWREESVYVPAHYDVDTGEHFMGEYVIVKKWVEEIGKPFAL